MSAYNTNINNAIGDLNPPLTPAAWVGNHKGYIPANAKKTVCFKLLSGLLNQPKWIPLRYAPITLEIELVNAFTDGTEAKRATFNGTSPTLKLDTGFKILK